MIGDVACGSQPAKGTFYAMDVDINCAEALPKSSRDVPYRPSIRAQSSTRWMGLHVPSQPALQESIIFVFTSSPSILISRDVDFPRVDSEYLPARTSISAFDVNDPLGHRLGTYQPLLV